MKKLLASPSLLSSPQKGETLFLYLSVTEHAVSAVLIRKENDLQMPIYYTSKVLHGTELRYTNVEKFAFALVQAARRLRPYFQAHPVVVLIDQPLK